MIANILIFLLGNTLLPYLPLNPLLLTPLPLALPYLQSPSAYHDLNISRLYRVEDFKKSFR